jgi:hypothetical protein
MIRRRLVAVFLAWHLFAIFGSSLPAQNRLSLSRFPERDPSTALNPAFHRVTVALDAVARRTEVVESGIWRATRPLQRAINYYVRVTGLSQTWSMFANAPTFAQYMRVRYYVQADGRRPWMATELVLPTNREDRVRTVQSFRDSYRDKALGVAIGRFYDHRKASLIAPETKPDQLPTDLAPVARYFAREFARTHLAADERLSRVEVWVGTAPIPPLGTARGEEAHLERAAVLESYYDGPLEQRINIAPEPPYHAGEREADIAWLLEYYEER